MVFFLSMMVCAVQWAQGLKVSIAPETVYVGDVMTVSVEAAGKQLQSVECLFSKPTQHAGQSSFVQNINGRVSMQLGIRKVPLEAGEYRLERLKAVTTSGETLTYDQHPVVKVQALVSNPDYQLTTSVTPAEPFPGDEVKVTLTLSAPALSVDGGKFSPFLEQSFFGGLSERAPSIVFEAMTTEDTPLRQAGAPQMLPRKTEGGRLVWTWEIPYYAVRSGEQHFPAPRLNDSVVTGVQQGQLLSARVMAMGEPLIVNVLAPPTEGRPQGFTGAIGTTFSAEVALSALNVNVGDPVQLVITCNSDGDESLLRAPTLPTLEGFRAYGEPQRKRSTEGTQFTYNLRPIQAGLLEIPPLDFAWFDRATRTYQIFTTSAIPLHARPSAQLMLLDEEGVMMHEVLPPALQLEMSDPPKTGVRPWAWECLLLGVVAMIVRLVLRAVKRLVKRLFAPLMRFRSKARACALLAQATTAAEAANAVRLWAGRPALTSAELRMLLPTDPVAERAVRAYASLEAAMYTGADDFKGAVEELQATLPKLPRPRHAKTSAALIVLLLLCCLPCRVHAADDFMLEQAKAVSLSATTREAYAQAADVWVSLVMEGDTRREVLLNGATCALFAEAPTVARQLLRSYEYYYGSDASSEQAQLAVAEALEMPLHWTRSVFAPHYRYSFAARRDVLLGLVGLLLLVCAVPWRKLMIVRVLVFLATFAVATSVLLSWTQDRSVQRLESVMEVES